MNESLRRTSLRVLAVLLLAPAPLRAAGEAPEHGPLAWPAVTRECRPWAYHWWLGSAVDPDNLARELRRYRGGGLGGVHVVPIYGAKGAEARYVEYLSPAWMELLDFAVAEAGRLGLGVDMTTGSGWCFGGPNVPPEHACADVRLAAEDVPAGATFQKTFPRAETEAVVAVAEDGTAEDLWAKAGPAGALQWKAGAKAWTVYALTRHPAGVRVKRAAPGGEGLMLNPASAAAMRLYLERFTRAFEGARRLPRAMYHDSYEYRTRWSPELLARFENRRGYRLQDHLHRLFAGETTETALRVQCDYRETMSDMMIDDVFPQWTAWCKARGIQTRNQAHGSPANILDLYALADVPETEMFGRGTRDPLVSRFDERFGEGDRDPLVCKFASSAAHVAGRRLVGAETGTWMAEHFCETLEELKCLVDLLFAAGVNHVVYHGCCYSPDDAAWPGWLFYASTQMNPRNSVWRDAPALNAYVARCQAVLQSGEPDNDLLVYWPVHDLWTTPPPKPGEGPAPVGCGVHDRTWLAGQPLHATASTLWQRGYGFDYVSDRQLASAAAKGGRILLPGASYGAVVVPPARHVPVETLKRLLALAAQGGTVIFQDRLPEDVPGLADLEGRRAELKRLLTGLEFAPVNGGEVKRAAVGQGQVAVGDLERALAAAQIPREPLADHPGARLVRRKHAAGRHYFIANQGTAPMDGRFALATPARSLAVMDPMTGRVGVGPLRESSGRAHVYLRLEPGHSIILRTFEKDVVPGEPWQWLAPAGAPVELPGPWQVEFVQGGPRLPKPFTATGARLECWTRSGDPEAERFAGTAVYRTRFDAPGDGPWWIDLGRVCHSARVRLNGRDLGTLLMPPYRAAAGDLHPRGNLLEVEVTNLSANRIRDLDRRGVSWRIFHDINFVNVAYRPFDASEWPVQPSGLLGPVVLFRAVPSG